MGGLAADDAAHLAAKLAAAGVGACREIDGAPAGGGLLLVGRIEALVVKTHATRV